MHERRQTERRKIYLGGRVVFNKNLSTTDCVLRSVSEGGARFSCRHAGTLPIEFQLDIPHLGASKRVRVAWRMPDEVGVRFLAPEEDAGADVLKRLRTSGTRPRAAVPA